MTHKLANVEHTSLTSHYLFQTCLALCVVVTVSSVMYVTAGDCEKARVYMLFGFLIYPQLVSPLSVMVFSSGTQDEDTA